MIGLTRGIPDVIGRIGRNYQMDCSITANKIDFH